MRNISNKKYSSAKRLTDEEILFLADEESDSNAENDIAKDDKNSGKTKMKSTSPAPKRGRPKKIKTNVPPLAKAAKPKAAKPKAAQDNVPYMIQQAENIDLPVRDEDIEIALRLAANLLENDTKLELPDFLTDNLRTPKSKLKGNDSENDQSQAAKRKPGRPPKNAATQSTKATKSNKAKPQAKADSNNNDASPKRKPGRPPKNNAPEQLQANPELDQAAAKSDEPKIIRRSETLNELTQSTQAVPEVEQFEAIAQDASIPKAENPVIEAVAKTEASATAKRRGRPRKAVSPKPIAVPQKIVDDEVGGDAEGQDNEIVEILDIHNIRRPGRPRKDERATGADGKAQTPKDNDKETETEADSQAGESLADKVKKSKKRRGRRSKKNPFVVVISKDENKVPVVSEEEKATAITSIKDAISTTFKKETEPAPTVRKVIEPLTDVYSISQAKLLSSEERKNEFISRFIADVERFLIHEMYVDRSSKIVVAVSGGVDSIIMLDILALLSDKYKFSIFVAHYNHNLRGEQSEKDQEFVNKVAESYNLPVFVAGGKVRQYAEKNGISIEAAARFLRYSFLERTSRNLNADFVATAHTSDDSAETFLMNLLRGAGLTGLSGIPYRRQFVKDVLLIRPFINFDKATLIKYAKLRNIKWREDESNAMQNYTRNRVRHDLIPKLKNDYNPAIVDVINRTSKLLQGADRIIHGYVRNNLQNVLTDVQTDRFTIKLPIFQTFDRFIQGEMIQSALMKYLRVQLPSLKAIDRIVALQDSEIGAICEVNKIITAVRDRNSIVFARKQFLKEVNTVIDKTGKFKIGNVTVVLKEVQRKQIEFNKNPNVEYFDFDSIPPALFIRTWQEGDVFTPLGMNGTMKITDFLTNEKVAFVDRQNVLVLATKTEIIWVMGKRISENFKVEGDATKVLKVEIRYTEK